MISAEITDSTTSEHWNVLLHQIPTRGDKIIISSATTGQFHFIKYVEHQIGGGLHRPVIHVRRWHFTDDH